jgi:hypothetical protein
MTPIENKKEMKQYILIQNDGEIETNSFELIGASTKRDEKGKIGFFGSGLKYSIAYMMRKGIDFKIFSGLNELKFTTTKEQLKGKDFERICINGKETSYTVTMGPTWTEDWFVLREIYCNALDEGSCLLIRQTENVSATEGKTRIYVEITQDLKTVVDHWDHYFADERTPLFSSGRTYTCFLGHEDGESVGQAIDVYPRTNGILYRRGIRVYKFETQLYDYNFNHVNINEDRTAKNPIGMRYGVVNMVAAFVNEDYIKSILRTADDDKRTDEYSSLSTEVYNPFSDKWIGFSERNLLVVKEISARFIDAIKSSTKEVFLIPSVFARQLKRSIPEVSIAGMGNLIGNHSFSETDSTPKMNFLLKEVMESLKQMSYTVPYDIQVVEFENDQVLGQANIKDKKIYIASQTFDRGRREIAMTLMEECEHIKSGETDETRAFQTYIFSQWLKSMEEANGLFL